jgi:serine/threonine protein kinase
MVGQLVGSYKIQSVIKETEQWIEYLAQHKFLSKRAIVKALPLAFAKQPEAREKLKLETQKTLQTQHAHTLLVYDCVETSENIFIITEQIQGKNITEYLQQEKTISEEKAIRLFLQVLDATSQIHDKGQVISHFSEENIIINSENQVKILNNANISDNPWYKSPEELKLGLPANKETNIYALGVLLNRMLGGNLTDKSVPLANISLKTKNVLAKALSTKPNQRFGNCKEFRQMLVEDNISTEVIDESLYFAKLPLYIFIGLFVLVSFLLYRIAQTEERPETLAFNLDNTSEIKKQIDSTKKIKRQKQAQDSIRNTKSTKKDTIQTYVHKVLKGETLQGIAVRYNLTVGQIQKMNGLTSKSVLKESMGIRVQILEMYKVLPKENLDGISRKYNMNRYEILRANNIINAIERKEIYEGRDLIIPIRK